MFENLQLHCCMQALFSGFILNHEQHTEQYIRSAATVHTRTETTGQ